MVQQLKIPSLSLLKKGVAPPFNPHTTLSKNESALQKSVDAYIGIGGGGRCITGVVAGIAIDWPDLLWRLRGAVKIPIIVEGGANDKIPETLALGASGIGVVGKFGGTIETPGGTRFFIDGTSGNLFKFYGGEASDRMRAKAGRIGPFGRAQNTEGETKRKWLAQDGPGRYPTLVRVLAELMEATATGQVFQGCATLEDMHQHAAKRLRWVSSLDVLSRRAH